MANFTLAVPIHGYLIVDVDAKNADEAMDIAVNRVSIEARIETNSESIKSAYIEELGPVERIVSGNIVYVDFPEVEILEGEDEDEDEDEE